MGLAQAQRLLARLATDGRLRARFADDPAAVADEFGLSPEEAANLAKLPTGQLDDFARSLVGKRRRAVESLLPLTSKVVCPARFAALFRDHARAFVPLGIKKHRDDAVAFAHRVADGGTTEPTWLADLAKLEAAALLAHDPARRWLMVRLRHHPTDLTRRAIDGGPEPSPRPTLLAWFRPSTGSRPRLAVLARPW